MNYCRTCGHWAELDSYYQQCYQCTASYIEQFHQFGIELPELVTLPESWQESDAYPEG
jgi:hypothetical protein